MRRIGLGRHATTRIVASICLVASGLVLSAPAYAVPSFARQTGLACEACHTVFPQLTPFGRTFKAAGYTLFNTLKISDINQIKQSTLSLSDLPPVSVMAVGSVSQEARANDAGSSKSSTDFPQQLSIFYAGRIADNVGAYIQVTYDDQSGTIGMDNTDIRFADVAQYDGHSVVYGLSINNNPTVQDLWNSTPAWSPPFMTSPALQSPPATRIEGSMAQVVAGASGYILIDASGYAEIGVYRSALQGASVANNGNTNNDIIQGVTPYWRLAYEDDWGSNSWEVGTYGLLANLENPTTPAGNAINVSLQHAPTDHFLDVGLDTQYQYIDDVDQLTITARWVHENQDVNASFAAFNADNPHNNLDTMDIVGSYFWHRRFGVTLGFFNTTGSTDLTYYGGAKGKPNSTWMNFEVNYVPWLNVKIGLQYTAYFEFDGASTNYDTFGRNASDNNMLFGYLWLAF